MRVPPRSVLGRAVLRLLRALRDLLIQKIAVDVNLEVIDVSPVEPCIVDAMTDADLRALYQYVRSLGVSGTAAPAYVPPDKQPKPPYVQWPGVK